uniref:Uncharacterized protein n=1 Tax=Anguilla anguilla TaxID=7936 RepID=A0A0E9TC31_ANGAN
MNNRSHWTVFFQIQVNHLFRKKWRHCQLTSETCTVITAVVERGGVP